MRTVSIGDETMDSRDIEARIDELEDERATLDAEIDELQAQYDALHFAIENGEYEDEMDLSAANSNLDELSDELAAKRKDLVDWDESDEGDELKALKDFRDEVGSREWTSGLTLINESYWERYVVELLADIGDLPRDLPDYIEIDWQATAENVRADYSTAEIDGETYYYRD